MYISPNSTEPANHQERATHTLTKGAGKSQSLSCAQWQASMISMMLMKKQTVFLQLRWNWNHMLILKDLKFIQFYWEQLTNYLRQISLSPLIPGNKHNTIGKVTILSPRCNIRTSLLPCSLQPVVNNIHSELSALFEWLGRSCSANIGYMLFIFCRPNFK